MSKIEAVFTEKAPKPLPQFSQAVKFNGLVYCSGNIGIDPQTFKTVEGTVKDRTVCFRSRVHGTGIVLFVTKLTCVAASSPQQPQGRPRGGWQ